MGCARRTKSRNVEPTNKSSSAMKKVPNIVQRLVLWSRMIPVSHALRRAASGNFFSLALLRFEPIHRRWPKREEARRLLPPYASRSTSEQKQRPVLQELAEGFQIVGAERAVHDAMVAAHPDLHPIAGDDLVAIVHHRLFHYRADERMMAWGGLMMAEKFRCRCSEIRDGEASALEFFRLHPLVAGAICEVLPVALISRNDLFCAARITGVKSLLRLRRRLRG